MPKGKTATVFFCQNCGYESAKWMGQCPGCKEWNSFVEEAVPKSAHAPGGMGQRDRLRRAVPTVLSEVAVREEDKLVTGMGRHRPGIADAGGRGSRNREVHSAFTGVPQSVEPGS